MNKEFAVHMLNDTGKRRAQRIAELFDELLCELTGDYSSSEGVRAAVAPEVICPPGRELSLVRTHLEIAAMYAKKSMSLQPENTVAAADESTEP